MHHRSGQPGEHRQEGPRRAQRSEHDGRTHAAPTTGEHPSTDQAGTLLHEQRFGPFGTVDNPSWQSQNPAVRRVTRGYTGHEHDPETGLVNMGARLYDARIARFTSPDPTVQAPGFSQAWNRYSYAWNNPFAWVDPTGLEGEPTMNGEPADLGLTVHQSDFGGGTSSDANQTPVADPLAEFFPAEPPSDFPLSEATPPLVLPTATPGLPAEGEQYGEDGSDVGVPLVSFVGPFVQPRLPLGMGPGVARFLGPIGRVSRSS